MIIGVTSYGDDSYSVVFSVIQNTTGCLPTYHAYTRLPIACYLATHATRNARRENIGRRAPRCATAYAHTYTEVTEKARRTLPRCLPSA